jgi:tetratricopeptide (TPR) repeat protein
LRDDVRLCTSGNENWSVRVEACSRLIESGLLNTWQMASTYNQRGMHYAQTQPERALADYNSALKLRPQTPQILMNRVNIHVARGHWDAAVTDSSKAIEMWIPALAARARVVRARAYYELRDNDKAKADLDEAQKVDADDPESYLMRGNIDYDEKRFAAAARYFEQYCKRRPHDPVGFIGRGMALEADSRFDEALLAYETAMKLDPTDSRATAGRDRAKRRQPCDSSLCWNQPKKMPGWQDTIGPR